MVFAHLLTTQAGCCTLHMCATEVWQDAAEIEACVSLTRVCGIHRWSAVSRTERYRKRCGDEGSPAVDESNPLPKLIDPVTLEPVVTPAISPWGHVMGMATWKVHCPSSWLDACTCET